MTRINVYDRSSEGDGRLLFWFESTARTDVVQEDTAWDGNNHRGVLSGLQVGYEALWRTAKGRWVRHYDSTNEYNGPEYFESLTDDQAREWLIRNNTTKSDEVLEKYFGELEEEPSPSKGGRPTVGPAISVAYPEDLLKRIDTAADRAELSRAAWLRQTAETAVAESERRAEAGV